MTEQLKPCPFCGGGAKAVKLLGYYWAECTICPAKLGCEWDYGGPEGTYPSEAAVTEEWNRRAL